MRKRRTNTEGSLDLLLDTMCNAFGGIVLIAILVALLIEKPGEDADTTSGDRENAKQLVEKQKQLEELKPRVEEMESELKKMGELVELLRERNELAGAVSEMAESGAKRINSLADRLGEAQKKQANAEATAAQLNQEISSLREMVKTLQRQEEKLLNQEKDLINERRQDLKAPVLGSNPGRPFNIIYRYGLVYPLQHFTRDRNGGISAASFNAEMIAMRGGLAEPIPEKGIDPVSDREKVLAILNGLMVTNRLNANEPSEQIFLTNLVYADSFDAFREVENMIRGVGNIESGWRPFTEDDPLQFGPGGSKIGTQK
ncbi:MAG: hypothetical protein P1U87_18990 [Verrucomicrobiales bacterium]|nr:hypothetical protein [Verrucomicrobiales bacterium]